MSKKCYIYTLARTFEFKHANKYQGHFLGWLFQKQWVCLLEWYDKLRLSTKDVEIKIHDF
jgi:hypothetical protein